METGVYEIEGKLMYAQVFDAETPNDFFYTRIREIEAGYDQ